MKVFIDDIRDPKNYLTPEQADGIIWIKEWWSAKRFLIDHAAEIEVIHFDHYMDEPTLTGKDLFFMVAGDCMWGGKETWIKLQKIYLHSSDVDMVEELVEEYSTELAESGVELIDNHQERNY
ncbi:hypothetical protein FDH34_gp485 [Serratia phage BF]|uniref:Cyclic-phosphate processing Receiver domain-containing protein n=2 Tax=Eneladusvirus BF TaxID=2560751 RepID=A0A7L8ZLM9_9CAUD|nr:hypothetical protein FDH34_gp485 [Serratia phage BF]AQW88960.1 hypothetical protein BF_0435 [Serratia phage BF]QOI71374.1 hypothetical protein pEaSNUABM12_00446 [Erwinia phage pEa_SNUABM_12]QXO11582.1 hypothetical protein pEaSNUABM19_00446 [Erwinia phage pEa_SNUABM_19]